ncbi:hypothetical protein GCM10007862_11770 [Dyella lipolytica]|uniref:Peptidoglycan-binding protein n=1 Tax=Dyella lipolytica TaxID=1867835 RepID=A0ABW8IUR1_9GAMM|nr:peptidoglycan-binding domain-containing protein [Dyella lipolytica]GLQ46126.1 hypothetical protein GCM10007862_11770 [Dyella lipolytica]
MSNPLLDLISHGESGVDGYNAYNRGTYIDAQGKPRVRPANEPIDFSSLTLGQVQDMQHLGHDDPKRLLAVGKYQVIPKTMDDAINKLNLDRNQLFTPELQDKIFSDYLIVDKRPDVRGYIIGKPGVSLEDAQRDMAKEWGSFGDPDNSGHSHYPPPNKSSITLEQSADALNQMRAQYKASVDRGLTSDAAWQAVTDSGPSQTQVNPQRSLVALHNGVRGEVVRALQVDLAALGYTDNRGQTLQPDGLFGRSTEAAVRAFQGDNGLRKDGIAGTNTLEAIHSQRQLLNHIPALARELEGNNHIRIGAFDPADRAPTQGDPRANTSSTANAPMSNPFANPCHPDHGLYAELKERIPDASENRLAQMTAACHMSGIKPGRLGDIHIARKGMVLRPDGPGLPAMVDNSVAAPPIQQTMQQVQAFDHQWTQQAQLNAQMAQQQSAPNMGSSGGHGRR